MADNKPSEGGKESEAADKSRGTLAKQVHFASAFITPFATAVALELEDFGLTQQRIDEIMLRSARRFGAMSGEAWHDPGQHKTDGAEKTADHPNSADEEADYFAWFKSAGGQAFDFMASLIGKHGPDFLEKLAPLVMDRLHEAISDYVNGASTSSGKGRSKQRR